MKLLTIKFLRFLIKPILTNPKLYLKVKDTIMLYSAEHLHRTVQVIRKNITSSEIDEKFILDIGCADGGTSVYFAKNFPECQVVGFEPYVDSYNVALKSCRNFKNINIKNIALSHEKGTAEFNVTENLLSSSLLNFSEDEKNKPAPGLIDKMRVNKTIRVETDTLDNQTTSYENILLIKLDTQGTELQILENGLKTLQKTKYVLTEVQHHHIYNESCQYYEIDDFLRKQSFSLVDIYVTYRENGQIMEFDVLYKNLNL